MCGHCVYFWALFGKPVYYTYSYNRKISCRRTLFSEDKRRTKVEEDKVQTQWTVCITRYLIQSDHKSWLERMAKRKMLDQLCEINENQTDIATCWEYNLILLALKLSIHEFIIQIDLFNVKSLLSVKKIYSTRFLWICIKLVFLVFFWSLFWSFFWSCIS